MPYLSSSTVVITVIGINYLSFYRGGVGGAIMDTIVFTSGKHFALRKAVAYFVREESLLGKYCDYDQLGTPISKLMCGWRGQDDMKQIDHTMLVNAFAAQGGAKNYCVPFWQIVGGEETNPDFEGYFIHVTNGDRITDNTGEKPKKVRVYKIGCTKGDSVLPEIIRDGGNHPLKDGSRMREFTLSKEGALGWYGRGTSGVLEREECKE